MAEETKGLTIQVRAGGQYFVDVPGENHQGGKDGPGEGRMEPEAAADEPAEGKG